MPNEKGQSIDDETFDIDFAPKNPIQCRQFIPKANTHQKPLIFTHGAGGTLNADAVVNFATGFARKSRILVFKGNMNLKSRVKMFTAVIDDRGSPGCIGGRSMGARAAVMAATEQTTQLILVSYPLHTDKETRDQILLDLPASMKVVFVSGENDSMCDLQRLQNVRVKMKCKSWLVVIEGADHGMNVKPKAATEEMGKKSGEIVAGWLESCNEDAREGRLTWSVEDGASQWRGWSPQSAAVRTATQVRGEKRKTPPREDKAQSIASKKVKRGKPTKK